MRYLMTLMSVACLGAQPAVAQTAVPASSAAAPGVPVPGDDVQATVTSRPLTIVAFGDSLTSGHRMGQKDAYPAVLASALKEAGLTATVDNHGVSGDTTARALRRFEAALDERPDIVILALGANDGLGGVPVASMRRNLEQMIEAAQARGARVLLAGMEALPLFGWQYTLDFHRVFPELAAKYRLPLVPFLLNGVLGNPDLMSSDGIHPNAAGAKVMAANIWPYLHPLAQELAASQRP